jgi:hypothetical protein
MTCKQPRKGDTVATRFGDAVVLSVHDHGVTLKVQTRVHGIETISRHAARGHWTVVQRNLNTDPKGA